MRALGIIIVALVCLPFLALSQDAPYRIIKESIEYRFLSTESKYDMYMDVNRVEISVSRKIKILTQEGVEIWKQLILPEPIDPLYTDIISPARANGFYLDEYKIESIELRYSHAGKSGEVNVDGRLEERRVFIDEDLKYGRVSSTVYDLPRSSVGDEIRIDYTLSIPYYPNQQELGSFRIFFHSTVPKSDVSIKISKTESARAIFRYVNGAEPHTSFTSDYVTDKWKFDALPSLLEGRARPYEEMPHVEVITTPNNLSLCTQRFSRMESNRESIGVGSTYNNVVQLNAFLDPYVAKYGIDSISMAIAALNDVASFEYDEDTAYFGGDKLFEPKFGDALESQILRESNKYEVYCAVLDGLNRDYMILTPMDKRVGRISNHFARSAYTGENIIAFRNEKGGLFMLHPKSATCGYYVDELPFYFEGTMSMVSYARNLVYKAQDLERTFQTRNLGWNLDRVLAESGTSTTADNIRHTSVQVSVDQALQFKVKGRVSLSGQFSTLCRPSYLCNEAHPYVDDQYNQPFGQKLAPDKKLDYQVIEQSEVFPYTFKAGVNFEAPVTGARIFLGYFINHVDDMPSSENRLMAYYPDFKQSDTYTIVIRLNDGMFAPNLPDPISISNSLGNYTFRIEQHDNQLQVFSQLKVKAEKIEPNQINDVIEIYQAIQRVESTSIQISKQ